MHRTDLMMATGCLSPQLGLATAVLAPKFQIIRDWCTSAIPMLQCVSLLVGIAVGISMLIFGWRRERRQARETDLDDGRDYLRNERIQHRATNHTDLNDAFDTALGPVVDDLNSHTTDKP